MPICTNTSAYPRSVVVQNLHVKMIPALVLAPNSPSYVATQNNYYSHVYALVVHAHVFVIALLEWYEKNLAIA